MIESITGYYSIYHYYQNIIPFPHTSMGLLTIVTAIDGMNDVYQWQRNKQKEDICQYYRVQIIAVSYLEGGN